MHFKARLDEATAESYIGKAIKYTLNQWPKLMRHSEDYELGIDNNIIERDIRPFIIGRKTDNSQSQLMVPSKRHIL